MNWPIQFLMGEMRTITWQGDEKVIIGFPMDLAIEFGQAFEMMKAQDAYRPTDWRELTQGQEFDDERTEVADRIHWFETNMFWAARLSQALTNAGDACILSGNEKAVAGAEYLYTYAKGTMKIAIEQATGIKVEDYIINPPINPENPNP